MTTFGLTFAGPLQGHYWYRWLDKVIQSVFIVDVSSALLLQGGIVMACAATKVIALAVLAPPLLSTSQNASVASMQTPPDLDRLLSCRW
jgi:hypothetical protein